MRNLHSRLTKLDPHGVSSAIRRPPSLSNALAPSSRPPYYSQSSTFTLPLILINPNPLAPPTNFSLHLPKHVVPRRHRLHLGHLQSLFQSDNLEEVSVLAMTDRRARA